MSEYKKDYVEVIRGVANKELNADIIFSAVQSYGLFVTEAFGDGAKVLIAKDTRASGHMIEACVCAALCSVGINAVQCGILPVAALSYLTKKYKCQGAVSVCDARESADYNGLTFFDCEGEEIGKKEFDNIKTNEISQCLIPTNSGMGIITKSHTALRDYVDYVKSTACNDISGLKIAIDVSYGAGYECCKLIFKELGADVEMLHNIPNGKNINENCGINHPEIIKAHVIAHKCDMGIIFDGSCHDFLIVDKNGDVIDEKTVEALCECDEDSKVHSSVTKALTIACSCRRM